MSCAVRVGANPDCCCRGHGDFLIRAEYPDKPLGGCFPCPRCFPLAAARLRRRHHPRKKELK